MEGKVDVQQEEEQEFTAEHVEQFNSICKQATEVMLDYQHQSQLLKEEIVGMVSIYNQNQSPQNAVPVDKIISITNGYQEGMKEVQQEYNELTNQLKNEEHQRNLMMEQITDCFAKLERMEVIFKEKAKKKQEEAQKTKEGEEKSHEQAENQKDSKPKEEDKSEGEAKKNEGKSQIQSQQTKKESI